MLIFGNGEFARVMQFHYKDSSLTVHEQYVKEDELPFEHAAPDDLLIAIGYRGRKKVFEEAIARRFNVSSYVSSKAITNGSMDYGVIVFEGNNLQPYSHVGRNTVLWSGSHVGHHSSIGAHCFITSHVVISGGCEIGDEVYIGVNATLHDHLKVGNGSIIQAGAIVDRDVPPDSVWTRDGLSKVPAHRLRI